MIKDLEGEINSKNKEVEKLFNKRKKFNCFHNYFNFGSYRDFRFKLSYFRKQNVTSKI